MTLHILLEDELHQQFLVKLVSEIGGTSLGATHYWVNMFYILQPYRGALHYRLYMIVCKIPKDFDILNFEACITDHTC